MVVDSIIEDFIDSMITEYHLIFITNEIKSEINHKTEVFNEMTGFNLKININDDGTSMDFHNIPSLEQIRSMKIDKIKQKIN
jgi:hypothetical protein